MIFTDLPFLLYFFPSFLLVYLLVHKKIGLSNFIIIIFSLLFYASFGIQNIPILVIPLFLDYIVAIAIFRIRIRILSTALLTIAIIANLGLLAYYKYANFLYTSIQEILGVQIPAAQSLLNISFLTPSLFASIIAPLGISFITFQRISYVIDVYRKKTVPTTNFLQYATYASLFPHLISGPIVRFAQIKDQLAKRLITPETIFEGTKYLVFGLFFKILIADQIFRVEEYLVSIIAQIDLLKSIILIFVFSFRIYFDFLGYSLIAMGLARLIGFDFPANFNSPYQATSITDFWRRWNMTLSSWLKDYLYIPLGGNRKGKLRTYINLIITMVLGGLWHGANWNFIIWGLIHGVVMSVERIFKDSGKIVHLPTRLSQFLTFFIVTIAWIIFRFTNLKDLGYILHSFTNPVIQPLDPYLQNQLWFSLPALIVAVGWSFLGKDLIIPNIKPSIKMSLALTSLFVFLLLYSLLRKTIPFIYFQF